MTKGTTRVVALATLAGAAKASSVFAQQNLHFTYLWHLEQPIYWPDRTTTGPDRYEWAWESIVRKDAGAANPANNLREIFGLDDRRAVYQYRVRDAISDISGRPEAGAQVSYSGGLIRNVQSLGSAGQLGYGPGWANDLRTARGWFTAAGGVNTPRLDIVLFPFHHSLLPLLDESTVRKEVQLYKRIYSEAWGNAAPMSKGLFPSEMAFSTRLIPILASEGVEWVIVSGEKISRACSDFPVVYGSGGILCDPPNRADQLNPAQGNYYRLSIDRGNSPAEAVPLAFTPQRARSVDPATGAVSEIIVVPASQSLSWKDGYAPLGTSYFQELNALNNPSRPMLVVLAHDGDNAWGGGYSYYREATPNLVSQAANQGFVPTVIQKYLNDHPVPANAVVHVEDGAWVNAEGDFGAPQFLNWNWPPVLANGQVDIENGWAEDIRNWAVITAAQNRVDTAEQISTQQGNPVRIEKVLLPDGGANSAERAWHYFLGSLNSGYMYYGAALDMEVKPSVACNRAITHANAVIGDASLDQTPPTVWAPQRWPWNPGSVNFGPHHGWQQRVNNGDFHVWTFVHDVSGVQSVTLKYRIDADGQNPMGSVQNETYAGGPEVGAWQSVAMMRRPFPAGNVHNSPDIDFFVMPLEIAEQAHARIVGVRSALVDYYVEAVDQKGNVRRSPIEHVWVGDGSGAGTGGDVVTLEPTPAVAGQPVTVTYSAAGRTLAGAAQVYAHVGYNNWATVVSPDPAMQGAGEQTWTLTVTPPANATQIDLVFNNGAGTWDNNGGQDWHFPVQGGVSPPPPPPPPPPAPSWTMDGVLDADAQLVAANNGVNLWAGVKGDMLYVATNDAGEGNDHFVILARGEQAPRSAMWGKAGQVAGWDAFLADENNNDYEGWFDAPASSLAATGPNGGVLEGVIDLSEEFGEIPTTVRLAVALYATPDGGQLLATHQVPASVNGNGNIDAAEYLVVDLCPLGLAGLEGGPCCIADFNGDGGVDDLDIAAFFAAFEAGEADVNGDEGVDDLDIAAFFTRFEEGC